MCLNVSQFETSKVLSQPNSFRFIQCTIYKSKDGDKDVWKYDKRFYTTPEDALNVRLIDEPPPFEEGKWKFIEGPPVTREKHESITEMIKQMNRGIATLKPITIA